jgi:hypothetical protein
MDVEYFCPLRNGLSRKSKRSGRTLSEEQSLIARNVMDHVIPSFYFLQSTGARLGTPLDLIMFG